MDLYAVVKELRARVAELESRSAVTSEDSASLDGVMAEALEPAPWFDRGFETEAEQAALEAEVDEALTEVLEPEVPYAGHVEDTSFQPVGLGESDESESLEGEQL